MSAAAETPFDLPNICFMGSAVVSGIGCGVVVLTGPRTAFGLVASDNCRAARAHELRQGHHPVYLADAPLHRGDGALWSSSSTA